LFDNAALPDVSIEIVRGGIMRALVCVLVAVLMLAGAGLYAMEPASAGSGAGEAQPAKERAKAMPFKPGSEPAKGFADADIEWGAHVREFPELALRACDVYGFADLCLYRASDEGDGVEEVDVDLLFWRDRLFGVELTAQGRKNWAPFRRMVFEEFGGPAEPATGNEFEWQGAKARAHLSYSHRGSKASLLIVSVEIGDEMGRASGLGTR
jgi:hypothetical protein